MDSNPTKNRILAKCVNPSSIRLLWICLAYSMDWYTHQHISLKQELMWVYLTQMHRRTIFNQSLPLSYQFNYEHIAPRHSSSPMQIKIWSDVIIFFETMLSIGDVEIHYPFYCCLSDQSSSGGKNTARPSYKKLYTFAYNNNEWVRVRPKIAGHSAYFGQFR